MFVQFVKKKEGKNMKKEMFFKAINAIRKHREKEEKIVDFIDQFTDSHQLVFKSSELENFIFNLLTEEYGHEDLLIDFIFFPENNITIGINDNDFIIKNDVDLYYFLEYCTDIDNLYTLCEYMQELGLYKDKEIMELYKYVFDNIGKIIEKTSGNVKALAMDFRRIKEERYD